MANMMAALHNKLRLYLKVNWVKTLYFNFRKFPFSTARKLPIIFYGPVAFGDLSGKVIFKGPVKKGMIGFGQHFELPRKAKGTAEFILKGQLIFNGEMHIGKDVFFYVGEDARCELGYMSCLGSDVRLICTESITIGDWTGIGYESQVIDTNSHPMKNSQTGEAYPISGPIVLGTHNAFSNRISIMPHTKTPDFCVIASNTVCNKDYTPLGNNILLGGIPAKLLREHYTRDWEGEKELLKQYKIIKW